MDFSGRIFLATLEEDNEQKSLFRVKLLVDENGLVDQEELDQAGDEGYLRIVPDRQEQYTFKERLRLLGPICLVDLKHIPPELMKVRPNKNYAPSRGEVNQYVLYSDTVHAIHTQPVYEVVSNPHLKEPLTRGYYLRKGGNIQGPYDRETGDLLDGLSCIAPDSDKLFAVELADGQERMFFWPRVVPGQTPLQRWPEATLPPPAYEESGWTPAPTPLLKDQPPAEPTPLLMEASSALRVRELAATVAKAMARTGFACSQDDAVALLTCLTLFPWVRLQARHRCDALLAAQVLADALGTGEDAHDGAYRFTPAPREDGEQQQLLMRCEHCRLPFPARAEDASPWPAIQLCAQQGFRLPSASPPAQPASADQVRQALEETAKDLPEAAMGSLAQIESALISKGGAMPLALRRDMLRFVSRAHPHLEGGAMDALRYAESWLLRPFLAQQEQPPSAP